MAQPRTTILSESGSRGTFSYSNRKTSLKEMPSFREQASQALNRQDELRQIKERLSFNRDLLHGDPASKPWLRKSSLGTQFKTPSASDSALILSEPTTGLLSQAFTGTYTATPAQIVSMTDDRIRNYSRGTSASHESDDIPEYY